jgi:hypothetical protein
VGYAKVAGLLCQPVWFKRCVEVTIWSIVVAVSVSCTLCDDKGYLCRWLLSEEWEWGASES